MENPLRQASAKTENPNEITSIYDKNADQLLDSMDFEEGDIIMDYQCGSGKFMSEHLFPRIPNPSCICGVDTSPQMIKFAYENTKNKENIYFAVGSILDKYQWTFKKNMVNKFIAYLVLCYVEDYRGFINKVYEFLRPGGQFGILAPFSKAYGLPYHLLSQKKWSQYAEKNELVTRSSFASWTYSDDIDAPETIKESLISAGFKIDNFHVEEISLDFPSEEKLCEFLCTLTSVLNSVPEKLHTEFIMEMAEIMRSGLGTNGFKRGQKSSVSVEWKFLNLVSSKKS